MEVLLALQVQENYIETIKELKEEVRSLLMAEENNTTIETIILIDTIERLGLGYHFEDEIEKQLQQIYKFHHMNSQEYDLDTTALQFRLLRQHRYNIPCDVFNKFKDNNINEEKFDDKFASNAKELLSLYQAAHLRMHGENILEEALVFTTHHLNRMLPQLVSPLRDEVKQALEQPVHTGIPRIEARKYIPIYETNHDAKSEMILKLAKLDFNFLQNMYKKELILLMRWDINEIDKLPTDCMRIIYECTLNLYEDYEREAIEQEKIFAVPYAIEAREKRKGIMLTGIECYMKHYGVSKQEATKKFVELADEGWKDVNTEWINSNNNNNYSIPKDYFEGVLNYARSGEVFYRKSDFFSDPEDLAQQIIDLFVDPIII
ncbi:hypothetical protein RD792_017358 [Penstemon davidsonii]|uniref:Terpene synthase n=1 Tax=Penstemon davidsonii TaxID=160366 RepID=A0ABR0CNG5_9LAMI|nr:hypothetical protein RD792_017358 [Penstemon davidsonii]